MAPWHLFLSLLLVFQVHFNSLWARPKAAFLFLCPILPFFPHNCNQSHGFNLFPFFFPLVIHGIVLLVFCLVCSLASLTLSWNFISSWIFDLNSWDKDRFGESSEITAAMHLDPVSSALSTSLADQSQLRPCRLFRIFLLHMQLLFWFGCSMIGEWFRVLILLRSVSVNPSPFTGCTVLSLLIRPACMCSMSYHASVGQHEQHSCLGGHFGDISVSNAPKLSIPANHLFSSASWCSSCYYAGYLVRHMHPYWRTKLLYHKLSYSKCEQVAFHQCRRRLQKKWSCSIWRTHWSLCGG